MVTAGLLLFGLLRFLDRPFDIPKDHPDSGDGESHDR
jgi:hypothetical protein